MTDDKMSILNLIKRNNDTIVKSCVVYKESFFEKDQQLISRIFSLNENSTDEEFKAVGLKKDNFIIIKNKNNEDIKYKNYDNEITKLALNICETTKRSEICNIYNIFFTKKGFITKYQKSEFVKIEEYSKDLVIKIISEIFKMGFRYILKDGKLLYSNLLKYTSQNIGDININELQSLISSNNYDKNREAIDFLMKVIARSGENIKAFKFLFNKYFDDKESKLKLVKDIFGGGNYETIHTLENNFFQQLSPEEKFQFVSDALVGACKSGKPELLEYVLENYSDCFNLKGKESKKSEIVFKTFKIACANKNKELLEAFLLEYKEPEILNTIILNKKEEINELFGKIENPEIVNLLLNKLLEINFDFDTSIKSDKSDNNIKYGTKTILHYAFENENLEIAKLLLNQLSDEKPTELVNIKDENGYMFFNYNEITKNKNLEIAKLLFSIKDFNLNEKDIYDNLLTYSIVTNDNIELFKFLLSNLKIDINKCNEEKLLNHVINWCSSVKGATKIFKLLLTRPELEINEDTNEDLIYFLRKSEDNELNKLIINHQNFNVNGKYIGSTILRYFVEEEKENIVKLLVNNDKINVNEKNEFYETALELAIKKQNEKILRILLSNKNIDVNCIKDEKGRTLLYNIVSESEESEKLINFYKKTISLLLAHENLDPNLKYNKSYTLLSKTIKKKNMQLTDFLLSQPKIKEGIQKDDSVKLLNKAIEAGNSEIIGLLISKDEINLNTPDENGKTAIQFAILSRKEKILIEAIKNAKELIRNDFNTLDEANKKIKEEKLKLLEEIENEILGKREVSLV